MLAVIGQALQPSQHLQTFPAGSTPLSAFTAEFFDKSKSNFLAYKESDDSFTIDVIGATTNVTAIADGVLQVPDGSRPRFAQFGEGVFCAHGGTLLRYTPTTGMFQTISGAPTARYITVSDNFIIVAYTTESASDNPLKIQWSGLNNPNDWDGTVDGSQAGEQVINGLGEIKNIVGSRQSVTILMDRGIVRGTYVGGDLKWRFETIETEIGCHVPDSVISVGPNTYFLSYEGIVRFNGSNTQHIGQNKVDQYIINNIDRARLEQVSVSYNKNYDTINWLIPVTGGAQEIIHYNPKLDKWGKSETDVNVIGIFKPVGENVDTVGKNVDDPDLPNTDDLSFHGGSDDLHIGLRGNEILTFNGPQGKSSLRTHEFELGNNVLITAAEISGISRNAEVSVEYRNSLDSPSRVYTSGLNSYNRAGIRANAKYFRVVVRTDGGFECTGLKIIYEDTGSR